MLLNLTVYLKCCVLFLKESPLSCTHLQNLLDVPLVTLLTSASKQDFADGPSCHEVSAAFTGHVNPLTGRWSTHGQHPRGSQSSPAEPP